MISASIYFDSLNCFSLLFFFIASNKYKYFNRVCASLCLCDRHFDVCVCGIQCIFEFNTICLGFMFEGWYHSVLLNCNTNISAEWRKREREENKCGDIITLSFNLSLCLFSSRSQLYKFKCARTHTNEMARASQKFGNCTETNALIPVCIALKWCSFSLSRSRSRCAATLIVFIWS